MSLKEKIVFLIIWTVISLVVGGVLAVTIFPRGQKEISAGVRDTTMVKWLRETQKLVRILDDFEWPKSYTIITVEGDTVEIDSATPYGDLPVTEVEWYDTIPFYVGDTVLYVEMVQRLLVKGEAIRSSVMFSGNQFLVQLEDKRPKNWSAFLYMGSGWFRPDEVPAAVGVGVKYKNAALCPTYARWGGENYFGAMLFLIL